MQWMDDSASHLQNLDIALLRGEASPSVVHEHRQKDVMYTVSARSEPSRVKYAYYNTYYVYILVDR